MLASIIVIIPGTSELDSRVTSHFGQWQEGSQKFCCGLRGACHHLPGAAPHGGKEPNFSVQPISHIHSLSDSGQVPNPL